MKKLVYLAGTDNILKVIRKIGSYLCMGLTSERF